MIETLRNETASTHQEDPSIPALAVTGIKFDGGDLSKPRYPSLIDYSRAPAEVQFEPGVQIISADPLPFTVVYGIDPAAGVTFAQDADGLPLVQSVAAPAESGPVPGLSAELLNLTTCRLTWNQAEAASPSTALRILCKPGNRLLTDPEEVDGGVYLAIVHRQEEAIEPMQGTAPGSSEPGTIKILGTDAQGRPRYDLFSPDVLASLPPDLQLEISFRVRQGATVQFSLLFSLDQGGDIRFDSVDGQVVVKPARPEQLRSTAVSDQGEECTLLWVQETEAATQGRVDSFFLEASDGELPSEIFAERARRVRIQLDPTVIQPPNCTSGGICV